MIRIERMPIPGVCQYLSELVTIFIPSDSRKTQPCGPGWVLTRLGEVLGGWEPLTLLLSAADYHTLEIDCEKKIQWSVLRVVNENTCGKIFPLEYWVPYVNI